MENYLLQKVAYLLVENFLNITKTWFLQVSDNPIKIIMNICERPFMELKLAGLVALKTIAEQFWGQEEINKCSGKLTAVKNKLKFVIMKVFWILVLRGDVFRISNNTLVSYYVFVIAKCVALNQKTHFKMYICMWAQLWLLGREKMML